MKIRARVVFGSLAAAVGLMTVAPVVSATPAPPKKSLAVYTQCMEEQTGAYAVVKKMCQIDATDGVYSPKAVTQAIRTGKTARLVKAQKPGTFHGDPKAVGRYYAPSADPVIPAPGRALTEILADIAANRPTTEQEKRWALQEDVDRYTEAKNAQLGLVEPPIWQQYLAAWLAEHPNPVPTPYPDGTLRYTAEELDAISENQIAFDLWWVQHRESIVEPYLN